MSRQLVLAAVLLTIVAVPRVRTEQPPILSVKDVIRRVAAYVDGYGDKASIVVATEHYAQYARSMTVGYEATRRRILADFAIVKVDALHGWVGFRDVLEVDGKPLPDREGRLVKLLTEAGGRYDEARRLSDESARFNIGSIERDFNVPTTVLFFFTPSNIRRFNFTAGRVHADGIWEIAFRETERPTLIRTPAGRSVPSSGTLWVNPADGTVVRTLLRVEGFAIDRRAARSTGRVDVTYQRVADLDMWLPASMDEDFEAGRDNASSTVSGRALYSNYRQFQTTVRIK